MTLERRKIIEWYYTIQKSCKRMDIDKKKIPRELNRRIALTNEERETIRTMYYFERLPVREIARRFEKKCSRRLIQMIIFPERYDRLKAAFRERRKDGRYKPTKESWKMTMREHRAYKRSIKDKLI